MRSCFVPILCGYCTGHIILMFRNRRHICEQSCFMFLSYSHITSNLKDTYIMYSYICVYSIGIADTGMKNKLTYGLKKNYTMQRTTGENIPYFACLVIVINSPNSITGSEIGSQFGSTCIRNKNWHFKTLFSFKNIIKLL